MNIATNFRTIESPFGPFDTTIFGDALWYSAKNIADALNMTLSLYRTALNNTPTEWLKHRADFDDNCHKSDRRKVFVNGDGAKRISEWAANGDRAKSFREWIEEHAAQNADLFKEKPESSIIPCAESLDEPIVKFTSDMFGEIRVIEIDGNPWFVGKDVVEALGYTDLSHSITDHTDEEDRINSKTHGQNDPEFGQRGTWLINESGLYSLILSSKLPTAKQFKHWVTSEVLPSIRKSRIYAPDDLLNNPDLMIRAMEMLKAERAKSAELAAKNAQLAEENESLSAENTAIAEDTLTWNWRTTVVALIRSYAGRKYYGNMQMAYTDFTKAFNKRFNTNLAVRRKEIGDSKVKNLDVIREDERHGAVRTAAALCRNVGLDVGKIINEVNVKQFGTDEEESED